MALVVPKESYSGKIYEVQLGSGAKAATIGGASALLETTSDWNGIKMHTVSKAFDVGGGKIYSVAFITADNNWKMFKDIADHVIYSAKVWR